MSDSNDNEKKSSSDFLRSPLVLVGLAVVVILAVAGAYFLGKRGAGTAAGGGSGSQGTQVAQVGGVCGITLDRLRAYGVVEPDTTLVSKDAVPTSVKDRVACTAKFGTKTYTAQVDERCSTLSDFRCLRIWNVTDSNGKTLFQHRGFLPPSD
jgi:hypothetical protein